MYSQINIQKYIDLLADTDELRYFGLGIYFYVEFFRRLCWLFFFMTIVQSISIYINYKGSGMDNYSLSFSSYLIYTTLGIYSNMQPTTRVLLLLMNMMDIFKLFVRQLTIWLSSCSILSGKFISLELSVTNNKIEKM